MGLLDRFATAVTGPPPPAHSASPGPDRPIRPMTASGARVNLRSPAVQHTRSLTWQEDAWNYRDTVDELRFASEFVENAMSQLVVYAAAAPTDPTQDPTPLDTTGAVPESIAAAEGITEHTRACATLLVDRLGLNQPGNPILGQLGVNFDLAGECYLLGRMGEDGEEWSIRSKSELIVTAGGARLQDPAGGTPVELRPDECEVLRLWNPHPRWQDQPDSPVRAMLGTLESMTLNARRGRAHDRSRISNGQALYLPWEFSLMRPGSAEEVDEDADPAMAALAEAMVNPIRDEEDPSAVVPVVIRGDAMVGDRPAADVIKTIQLHGDDPARLDERYEALVRRFVRGINLARERVEGLGDTTHWNGAVITADEHKMHIRPRAIRAVDSLTRAYMWAGMREMGVPLEQRRRVCLWFDASALIENPNREEAAKSAHSSGVISDRALRREHGFSDDDAPDERERLVRTLADGRAYEASIPFVVAMSGLDFHDPELARALTLVKQLGAAQGGQAAPASPRVVPGQATGAQSQALNPAPSAPRQAPPAPSGVTAAAKGRGPRDDPEGPSVAGLALMAADTGRVLMLQRAKDDPDDPAAGTWEFPGGHIEAGDETSLHGAMREWSEEVGRPVPDGGTVAFTWTSADGVYQGHVIVIPEEAALDLAGKRTVANPDDAAEQCVWLDPDVVRKYPDLRRECRKTPWSTLAKVAKTCRSPVTAAARPAGRYRVDEAACRRLAQIDRALTDRLIAHAEATVGRAVERAANRIRGRAQKNPLLAAAFPTGCDPVTIVAAAGRDVQGDLSDEAALAGALDEFAVKWDRETSHAAEQTAQVVTGMVGAKAATGLIDRLIEGARRAFDWLRGRLQRHITAVLYGETDADPVPTELVRGALTVAGGLPEGSPGVGEDGAPASAPGQSPSPHAGPATGATTGAALREGGAAELGWIWGYHGMARKDPFLPHRALDGRRYAGFDDPGLATGPKDGWIGTHYYPGDHQGCLCSIEMIWAAPTGEDWSSSEGRDLAALDETPAMRRIRELAESDDAAGRTGTTAQRDRDTAAEIAALRREHIGAREGAS